MECARFAEDPGKVLFCAFNNAIATEIRRKFGQRGMERVTVKTIHALGLNMLYDMGRRFETKESKYAGLYRSPAFQKKLKPYFEDLASANKLNPFSKMEKQQFALKNLNYNLQRRVLEINQKHRSVLPGSKFEAFREMVEHYGIFSVQEQEGRAFPRELRIHYDLHRMLLEAGNNLARTAGVIDFTDMIYLPFIWQLESQVKYDYIFIDECQDLSKAQFSVATKYGRKGTRILAVGDPRQSIYGFTGADAESFDRVARMTKATPLPLTVCFRCPRKVIDLAKEIRPDISGAKGEPGQVLTLTIDDVLQYALPGDLIVSRFRAPLLLLVFDFIDAGTKVRIAPDEVNEFIGELQNLFKVDERRASIKRRYREFSVLRHMVFDRNMWVVRKEAGKIRNPDERALFLQREEDYLNKRLDFLTKKHQKWAKDCTTVDKLLKKLRTFVAADEGAIRLSTIHRAKGLEEKRVFILDYDKLPFLRPNQLGWERTQEENLKYVAVTRAEESLFLVESPEESKE